MFLRGEMGKKWKIYARENTEHCYKSNNAKSFELIETIPDRQPASQMVWSIYTKKNK